MKKIKLTLFVAILGLLFASCKTDINQPVISSSPTSPAQPGYSYAGTFDVNHADSLITFTWKAADFGFVSSTTYKVQLSDSSDFSSHTADLLTTQKLSGTAKVSDINTLILSWNYNIGTPVVVYYRVAASVSPSVAAAYSDVKTTTITPYDAVINYPMIYVPGAYQGWSPGADNGRLFSYGFNSQYDGIVRIIDGTNAASEFKIAPAPNWNNSWGGTLTKSGNDYSGTLDPSGGNFTATAGVYAISVNVNALTISLTKTDDWGIIGSSIPPYDWSADVDMFYNGQRKMWEITGDFKAGEFKFRANNDWSVAYGDGGNGALSSSGSAPNLQLAADGNYTIRFDPVKLIYTVKKN